MCVGKAIRPKFVLKSTFLNVQTNHQELSVIVCVTGPPLRTNIGHYWCLACGWCGRKVIRLASSINVWSSTLIPNKPLPGMGLWVAASLNMSIWPLRLRHCFLNASRNDNSHVCMNWKIKRLLVGRWSGGYWVTGLPSSRRTEVESRANSSASTSSARRPATTRDGLDAGTVTARRTLPPRQRAVLTQLRRRWQMGVTAPREHTQRRVVPDIFERMVVRETQQCWPGLRKYTLCGSKG